MCEVKMSDKPYVEIIEEPCSKEGRFRYDSEGRFAEILGVKSNEHEKSYPTIQIMNHTGSALVVLSCVTKDAPHKPHPHNIVGKLPGISQGICCLKVRAGHSIVTFSNFGIQRVKKKEMSASLAVRERLQIDPFQTGYPNKVEQDRIDLTCVRLCFQVYLESQGQFNVPLDPVVSAPIYDNKKKLRIVWRSHYSTPVNKGVAMCLLCDKVSKEDIEVVFFSKDKGTHWETAAEFTAPRCYKQHALVFKTPEGTVQELQDLKQPVEAFLQLRRPSDGEVSTSVPFQFLPEEYASEDAFKAKRQKCRESPRDLVMRHMKGIPEPKFKPNLSACDFSAAKTEEWELPSRTTYIPNIVEDEPMRSTPAYNRMNQYSEAKPSTSNAMATDNNYVPYNEPPTMKMFNQMTRNSMMNNGSMQQMVHNGSIRQMAINGSMQQMAHSGSIQQMIHSGSMQPVINNGPIQPVINNGPVQPMINNRSMQQMIEPVRDWINYDQLHLENTNGQRNEQNCSYLNELITSMDENLMV